VALPSKLGMKDPARCNGLCHLYSHPLVCKALFAGNAVRALKPKTQVQDYPIRDEFKAREAGMDTRGCT